MEQSVKIKVIKMKYNLQRGFFAHADKHGAPVLIEKSSWRTINGFVIGKTMILFRRHGE